MSLNDGTTIIRTTVLVRTKGNNNGDHNHNSLNCEGSVRNSEYIHSLLSSSSCDFLCLSETWLLLTRIAEPIPTSGQSSSYSLTTLSSSSSTDRRAETDRIVITTRIAVAHHFRCRMRRRESCILGTTSCQPTLPLHELPPARLVIHRQTSAHERRKGTCSIEVGHISGFLPPATLAVDNGRAPHYRRAPRGGCCSGGRSLRSLYAEFWARNH